MHATRGGAQVIPRPVGVRAGSVAPWAHLPPARRRLTMDRVQTALGARPLRTPVLEPFPIRRHAAVLVPLYQGADGLRLLLTRRPAAMRSHSGEVSFPGGGREEADADLSVTALREAEEEIGLDRGSVDLFGRLDPLATIASAAMIEPYVGFVHRLPALRAQPVEVAAILHVPVDELLEDGVFHQEWWPMPPHLVAEHGQSWRPMFFYELTGDTVWGATARMLTQLLAIATGTEPDPAPVGPSGAVEPEVVAESDPTT